MIWSYHQSILVLITDSPKKPAPKGAISPRVATKNKWRRIEVVGHLRAFVAEYRQAMTR